MLRHFLWILFLFSCHSNVDTDHKISSVSDTSTTLKTDIEDNELKKHAILFDNRQPFEISSFTSTLYRNTTDKDTAKCSRWQLTKTQIEKIIKNSEPIDGTTWDLTFLVMACTKSVNVVQSGQQFMVKINAASFFSINNGDTTVLYGDFKKSDRKYFIEGPYIEE